MAQQLHRQEKLSLISILSPAHFNRMHNAGCADPDAVHPPFQERRDAPLSMEPRPPPDPHRSVRSTGPAGGNSPGWTGNLSFIVDFARFKD